MTAMTQKEWDEICYKKNHPDPNTYMKKRMFVLIGAMLLLVIMLFFLSYTIYATSSITLIVLSCIMIAIIIVVLVILWETKATLDCAREDELIKQQKN